MLEIVLNAVSPHRGVKMIPYFGRLARPVLLCLVLITLFAVPCAALTLLAPTEGQAVREQVAIDVPSSAVPDGGSVSIYVGQDENPKFVAAIGRTSARDLGTKLRFYWNSKSSYYNPSAPMSENYFKDGVYTLKVRAHDAEGVVIDSGTVSIALKNKVARPSPAPAVALANKLTFGRMDTYAVHAQVDVFDSFGLPVYGGLGLTSDFKVIQSVEDVRPNGDLLLRYRIDEEAHITSRGVKTYLYESDLIRPQLYRLVTKYGKVLDPNLFRKQAGFSITDVLPVLSSRSVNEGDSWPDTFNVKVEGITNLIGLAGDSMLDSFEWEENRECAKIMSRLAGKGNISLEDGKIESTGNVDAEVTTYFSYKSGRMLKRIVNLEFPVTIQPGAGQLGVPSGSTPGGTSPVPGGFPLPGAGPGSSARPTTPTVTSTTSPGTAGEVVRKGTVRISVVMRLEI